VTDKTQGGSHGSDRKVDLNRVIRDLNEQKNRLERIIGHLEQLRAEEAANQKPRSRRGRKSMDAEGRAEVSRRMRRYWEEWRANKDQTQESFGSDDGDSSSHFGVVSLSV